MPPDEKQITQLYIGYFNRAADANGLAYWLGRADDGMTFAEIAASFAVQPEFNAIYSGLSNDQLLGKIYLNLFDRQPDPEGKAYWANELNSGVSPGQLMVNILSGAQGADRLKLDNAATVAGAWTKATAHIPFDIEQARLAISTIDEIQPVSNGGLTVNLGFNSAELLLWEGQLNAAIKRAWADWEQYFPNDVQVQIDVGYYPIAGLLASASTRMEVLTEGGYTLTGVMQEINTGRDPNGFQSDGFINIHMDLASFFGAFDAVSVLRHEFGHILAFRSAIFDPEAQFVTSYDRHISASGGTAHFDGPEAMRVYGGPVPIPQRTSAPSSGDFAHLNVPSSLMEPFFAPGEVRLVGVLEVAALHDAGLV